LIIDMMEMPAHAGRAFLELLDNIATQMK
jgi:hypothetical protein